MQSTDNVVQLKNVNLPSSQEIIDDISANAFLFLRDAAEEMGIPLKEVIVEHMMGMALVMTAVEGEAETQNLLNTISTQLNTTET